MVFGRSSNRSSNRSVVTHLLETKARDSKIATKIDTRTFCLVSNKKTKRNKYIFINRYYSPLFQSIILASNSRTLINRSVAPSTSTPTTFDSRSSTKSATSIPPPKISVPPPPPEAIHRWLPPAPTLCAQTARPPPNKRPATIASNCRRLACCAPWSLPLCQWAVLIRPPIVLSVDLRMVPQRTTAMRRANTNALNQRLDESPLRFRPVRASGRRALRRILPLRVVCRQRWWTFGTWSGRRTHVWLWWRPKSWSAAKASAPSTGRIRARKRSGAQLELRAYRRVRPTIIRCASFCYRGRGERKGESISTTSRFGLIMAFRPIRVVCSTFCTMWMRVKSNCVSRALHP